MSDRRTPRDSSREMEVRCVAKKNRFVRRGQIGGLGIVTASSEAGELHALALSIASHRSRRHESTGYRYRYTQITG